MQTPWKQTSAHNTFHHIRHKIQTNSTGGRWGCGVLGIEFQLDCLTYTKHTVGYVQTDIRTGPNLPERNYCLNRWVSVVAATTLNFEFTVCNWQSEQATRRVIYFHFSHATIRHPTLILDTVSSLSPVYDQCSVTMNQKGATDVSNQNMRPACTLYWSTDLGAWAPTGLSQLCMVSHETRRH